MRKSKLSAAAIAEMDESQRRETRASGFRLMSVRDSGRARLSNGISVFWHHPARELPEVNGVTVMETARVPAGYFGIDVDGKMIIFDGEELQKYLRWA